MQTEPFQERQTLKVRKQEAIGQLLLFLFLWGGWGWEFPSPSFAHFYCWNAYASVTSHSLFSMMTT